MDVSTIIANVKNLNFIGNTAAVSDEDKILAYINMAYRKIFDMETRAFPAFFQTTQDVIIANGSGTMGMAPHLILSVVDTGNNSNPLSATDVLAVEMGNPAMDDIGSAREYWQEGFSNLNTYPLSSTTLRVRYVGEPPDLTSASVSSDILIPPAFHDILMWQAAWFVAYDERDKIVGQELNFCQGMIDEIWGRLLSYLRLRVPRQEPRTKVGFVAY